MTMLSSYIPPNVATMPNVVRDFGAVGDAVVNADGTVSGTDNTAKFQAAVTASAPNPAASTNFGHWIYVPAGKYMISGRIDWKGVGGGWASCVAMIGEHVTATEIILTDGATGYDNPSTPKAMFYTASQNGESGNSAFKNGFRNMTFTVGANNPGAACLDMNVSNFGGVRDCHMRSVDPGKAGFAGLVLSRFWPGPALFEDVLVDGFSYGVDVGNTQYGVTFEHLTVRNQIIAGVRNTQNMVGIRDLKSSQQGGVPAVLNAHAYSVTTVIGAVLGNSGTTGTAAIVNTAGGSLRLRNIRSTNYTYKLANKDQSAVTHNYTATELGDLDEFTNGTVTTLFSTRPISLGLPVAECPRVFDPNPTTWANVEDFGAVRGGSSDQGPAIQRALNSGAATIFFPSGPFGSGASNNNYVLRTRLTIPPTVKRITTTGVVNIAQQTNSWSANWNAFTVLDGTTEPLFIENLWGISSGTISGKNYSITFNDSQCTIGSATITSAAGTFLSSHVGWPIGDGSNDASRAFPLGTVIASYVDAHTITASVPATVAGTRLLRIGGNYNPAGGLLGGHWIEHAARRPLILDEVSLAGGGTLGAVFRSGCGPVYLRGPHLSWYQEPGTRVWGRGVNMEIPPGLPGQPTRRVTNDGGDCWLFGFKTESYGTAITTINGGRTEMEGGFILPINPDTDGAPAFINVDSSHSLNYTCTAYQQYHSGYDVAVRETQAGVTHDLTHAGTQKRIGWADVIQLHVGRLAT